MLTSQGYGLQRLPYPFCLTEPPQHGRIFYPFGDGARQYPARRKNLHWILTRDGQDHFGKE